MVVSVSTCWRQKAPEQLICAFQDRCTTTFIVNVGGLNQVMFSQIITVRFKIVAQLIFSLLQHYKDTDIGVWSLGTIQTITLVISQWSVLLIETRSWVGIC